MQAATCQRRSPLVRRRQAGFTAPRPLWRPEDRGAGLLHALGDDVLELVEPPVQRREVFGLFTFTHEPQVWPADGGEPDPIEHTDGNIA